MTPAIRPRARCLIPILGGVLAGVLLAAPTAAVADLQVDDFSYERWLTAGGTASFVVRCSNQTEVALDAFTVIILTNSAKALEVEVDSATQTIPAGGQLTFRSSQALSTEGFYTVSIRVHNAANVQRDKVSGRFPIHVGTAAEALHLFPDALHLGTIPAGRHMHPVPLEIRWDFFRGNRLTLDQPFSIRLYSDNAARYGGIPGAVRRASPAGLVSHDGRFTIPIKIWTANFGPDVQETGWDPDMMGPPPVEDDTYWIGPLLTNHRREAGAVAWLRIPDLSEMSSNPDGWRRVIGLDPHDTRFVSDTNTTGDFTLPSPVTVYVATEAGPTAVQGRYATTFVVELYSP